MALQSAPARPRAPRAVPGVRRDTTRVLLDIGSALAPVIEGQALCDEVTGSAERLVQFAAAGSRVAVVNEAGRIANRAAAYRREFARMARELEA